MNRDLTREMAALIERLHAGLLNSSPEYRLLCRLQAAVADAQRNANPAGTAEQALRAEPEPAPAAAQNRSLRTTVHAILTAEAGPLPTGELLRRLMGRGITLNARNPRAALSSNLSQDSRFENVMSEGKPMWRLREPPHGPQQPSGAVVRGAQKRTRGHGRR
ncbi:hypothetical protein [Alsobacter soli]|nr:hypothetical protein [Alsobacter soli]